MERNLDQPLLSSVLDRLIDTNPELSRDPPPTRGHHMAMLRASVRRDIEALLNTRRRCLGWPAGLSELERSTIGYGIPDFTGANMGAPAQQEAFLREVERTIARFEPRFKRVKVTPRAAVDELDRTLRFRIFAEMYAEPAPEPLVFDSVLDPSSRNFTVASADNA